MTDVKQEKKPKKAKKEKKGVQEWCPYSDNIQKGCENNCSYGYCRKNANFHKKHLWPKSGKWEEPEINWKKLFAHIPKRKANKWTMFPTMHDSVSHNVMLIIIRLHNHFLKGNHILFVSKPRPEIIQMILDFMQEDGHALDLIEFRFTIGTYEDQIRQFREQHAPSIAERIECVKLLNNHNIIPSISCEPLLDCNNEKGEVLILDWLLQHAIIKEIWVGAMQYTKNPPILDYELIYAKYKDQPIIRWKESFRKHLKGSNPEIGQKSGSQKKDISYFLSQCAAPANLLDQYLDEIDPNSKKNCDGGI